MFDKTIAEVLAWLITVPVLLEKLGYFQRVPSALKPAVVFGLNFIISLIVNGVQPMIDPEMLGKTLEEIITSLAVAAAITAVQFVLHKIELWITAKVEDAKVTAQYNKTMMTRAIKGS